MATTSIPVLNPLTTLIFLHGYRRRLISQFKRLFSPKTHIDIQYIGSSGTGYTYDMIKRRTTYYLAEGAHRNFGHIRK